MRYLTEVAFVMLAVLMCARGFGDDEITTTITDLPTEVVEGGEITLTVNYDIAPGLGQVPLRVELKNFKHIVLTGQRAIVGGKGRRSFTFTAPKRAEEAAIMFAVWYGMDWRQAIVPIIQTDRIAILSQQEAAKLEALKVAAKRWRERQKEELAEGPRLAVLVDDLPGFNHKLAERMMERLKQQGLRPMAVTAEEVANPHILTPEHFHGLALTSSRVYPSNGAYALERFLAGGGDLIALGTPAFREGAKKIGGEWMTESEMRQRLAQQKPERILWDFESGSAEDWAHSSGGGPEATWEFAVGPTLPSGPGTKHALHCVIPNFTGWNTFAAPKLERPLGPGQELTCLWAKGGPRTTRLSLEWVEQDGSRWIATIPLSPEWQYYALTPHEFRYWRDNPSEGRGGEGDHLRPENAASFTVGMAMTHTRMPSGHHEFWVDQIGVGKNPFGMISSPQRPAVAPVEMITPSYKCHRVTNATEIRASEKQCLLAAGELPLCEGLMSAHPRPQGTGCNKERKWRWIPLIEAFDEEGEVCGTPACLVVNRVGRFRNSVTASFAFPEAAYETPELLDMIATVAKRMRDGFFLFEGGAEYYAYFQGEDVVLGARTINTSGGADPGCSVKFFVTSEIGTEFERTVPLKDGRAECTWSPGQFAKRTYEVLCTLLDDEGNMLDMLTHPVVVWAPSEEPQYMEVKDGGFRLRGKKWCAHGVNYMPSSEIGIEDGQYFEYWMDKQPYDPVVIERDLRRIKAMGMNMVSIFCYYRSLESRNLLDILERCRRHDLMVNLSLRPGTPLDFRWEEMKALIESYRLAEHDIIFAYDLAWEPAFWGYDRRKRWDAEWEKWVTERYGSIENAEEDWAVPVPRSEDGKVTGPSDWQLDNEGDHRVMACAYRRFLDDLLAKAHATANGLVKSIDPNHFTSFRMTVAGDPTRPGSSIAYDFRGLARSCDIMEPEGYGRTGDWERVKPGRFTADYARCMAPGRPVMWAEHGRSTWSLDLMDRDPAREEWAGEFYGRFYQMAYESGANGTICWWYPGGYRCGERSDYGIINPDGTWRPVSHAIHDQAELMMAPRSRWPVTDWITIDRDATVKGVTGVYETIEEEYWRLIEERKYPGLRTDGYGLDSATAPRIAVGNVPYREGRNPHKYLNAEFDRLEMKNSQGEWQAVTDGSVVKVKKGDPVLVRATVGNIGEAKWLGLPPGPLPGREGENGRGSVAITCGEALKFIPHDVPFMGTVRIDGFQVLKLRTSMKMTFEMGVWPDVRFGEKVEVRVEVE